MTEHQKRVPYAQLPKSLIKLPISNDAKLLFTLLNDRFQLSLKNDFKDEDGCVFCYFSNREICEKLRCAHGKATKLLRELEDAGLIYREKTIGKADHIYVGGVQEEDEPCRFPTEEVRSAFYQLKKEDLEEILADFLSDPAAFGSMRQRLFEAGRKHELEDGIVLASNDSWAHEAACQGAEPLKPHETEEAS